MNERHENAEYVLIQRLRARDEGAFGELLERYHAPLLRLALSFVKSRAVAEEVVQETWTGVIEGVDRFEGRSSLKTWLFRILTNRAKTRGVREGRSVPFSALFEVDGADGPAVDAARFRADGHWASPPTFDSKSSPEDAVGDVQLLRHLESALSDLPPSQRVVVTMRDVEGFEPQEVCDMLGISEANVRVLLHRGRSRLRAVLEQHMGRG